MTEKCMTILFKKHIIAENEFLYKPEKTIIITEKDGSIYDEDNNLVFPVHSLEACNDEVEYATDSFYCNYQTYLENNELDDIEEEIKNDYFELNKQFYVYATTNHKEVQTTGINLGVNLGLNSDNLDYARKILENVKKRQYTNEDLKCIRNSIRREEFRAAEIGKLYDKIISIDEIEETEEDEYQRRGLININGLYNKVTKTLVAQEEAAEDFITQLEMLDLDNTNRKGILLTGDSGVGKTKLVELVSKNLNRPFLFIDSTQLTMPGYVGKNIEEYLYDLLIDCDFDIELAEEAIVFFDEIDKKGSSKKSDVSGQGVLNQLLKFLDGETYSACHDSSNKSQTAMSINTSNMIIVAGGAFNDVYHNADDNSEVIGFTQDKNQIESDITIDDFVDKAQMPREFMGRFSVIHLNSLKAKDFERILKESDESPITSAENRFKEMDNVKLTFTDSFIESAAQLACQRDVGVRGLSEIITNSTKNPFRYVNQNLNKYQEVIIDDRILYNPDEYELIEKEKTTETGIQKVKK